MGVLQQIRERAAKLNKTIVLPESKDPRILEAASIITKEGIAKVILLGDPEEINKAADVDLTGVEIIDYLKSDKMDTYIREFTELRKHKGMTLEKAAEILKNPLYYATMMVKLGDADGMTAGAVFS